MSEDLSTAVSSTSNTSSTQPTTSSIIELPQFNFASNDVLCLLFKHLDIKDRLNGAKVCKRWNDLLKKWIDIQSIVISEKHFAVKNQYVESSIPFTSPDSTRINPMVLTFLKKCSHALHLVIHNAQVLKYFATIWSTFDNLELLVLPNDAFDELKFNDSQTLLKLLANRKLQSLHILEHVKSFASKKRIFAPLHVSVMAPKKLQIFHAQGVIIGPISIEKLAEKCGDSLRELRIGSVCVHTPDAARYWKALSQFKHLKVLELPPSLYSITKPLESGNLPYLSHLKKLEKLGVFVSPNSGSEVGMFLSYLPKTLQEFMVRTYADQLPDNVINALGQQKIKLTFLPKKAYSFRWPFKHSDGYYQLFLKGFWEPPYFPETELVGVTLTPEIIRTQTTTWSCALPDLARFEEESMAQEVVHTAQSQTTDPVVTTQRTSSPIPVTNPPDNNNNDNNHAIQEVVNGILDQLGRTTLNNDGTPAAASTVTPSASLQAQSQDGISKYVLSPLTTTARSTENIAAAIIEELQLDPTQQSSNCSMSSTTLPTASSSNESTSSNTASNSSEATTSTASSESTSSASASTATTSSLGTGWFV